MMQPFDCRLPLPASESQAFCAISESNRIAAGIVGLCKFTVCFSLKNDFSVGVRPNPQHEIYNRITTAASFGSSAMMWWLRLLPPADLSPHAASPRSSFGRAATSASCGLLNDLYTLLRGIPAWPCCRCYVASVMLRTSVVFWISVVAEL
jgi:hypothetical protein